MNNINKKLVLLFGFVFFLSLFSNYKNVNSQVDQFKTIDVEKLMLFKTDYLNQKIKINGWLSSINIDEGKYIITLYSNDKSKKTNGNWRCKSSEYLYQDDFVMLLVNKSMAQKISGLENYNSYKVNVYTTLQSTKTLQCADPKEKYNLLYGDVVKIEFLNNDGSVNSTITK